MTASSAYMPASAAASRPSTARLSAATVTDFGFALDFDLALDLGADRRADFRFALAMTASSATLVAKHTSPPDKSAKRGCKVHRYRPTLTAWDDGDAPAVPFHCSGFNLAQRCACLR